MSALCRSTECARPRYREPKRLHLCIDVFIDVFIAAFTTSDEHHGHALVCRHVRLSVLHMAQTFSYRENLYDMTSCDRCTAEHLAPP
mmetsp:Transcript_16428/g.36760  ORF Transcript_16428/g.36760 Transcript_16428/m.36760 type:complete len:87 (-) Transcript_16428:626-886(-)